MSKKASKQSRAKGAKLKQSPKTAPPSTASAAPKQATVKITAAKGRPMLQWVGKKPLGQVNAFPAQMIECHDALRILGLPKNGGDVDQYEKKIRILRDLRAQCNTKPWDSAPTPGGVWAPEIGGLLYHGDNFESLAHLLSSRFRGAVDLVYIDPPFDSGADYVRRVTLRGQETVQTIGGESASIGEQIQYTDIWAQDNYLQFMYERLLLLSSLLSESGSIILHCDYRKVHHLRMLMEEVFGEDGFVNEIIWLAEGGGASGLRFGRKHQTLLYFTKARDDASRVFNADAVRVPYKTENIKPQTYNFEANAKKRPGFKDGYTWVPNEAGKVPTDAWLDCFLAEGEGVPLDVWYDVKGLYGPSGQLEGYPTQKPESLLRRIIAACSNPGDLVLDCFIGSGTTAAIAQELGRRWIGCDINKGAIQTASKRLRTLMDGQIKDALATAEAERQGKFPGMDGDEKPKPCQFGFTVYRVNDYDLHIQHNEAVNLACETVGVERTRTDRYFDGTRGRALVKIIPFGHPFSPIDLEELKRELDARPDEDRPVTIVCLGIELAAKAEVDEWNRLRKGKNAANRIEIIELRSDPKYGGFIRHEPAKARVKVSRKRGAIVVKIEDFVSPTIIQRLEQQEGVVKPTIEDWRQMVDCVMIDPAYDGQVLRVALADMPGKKSDFVKGEYEVPAPSGDETTIAVKIVDMLGEEVLVVLTV